MKTKLLKLSIGIALFVIPQMFQAQIETVYEDTWLKNDAAGTVSSSPWNNSLNIGDHAADTNLCAVFPFLLPAIPAGEAVESVTFDCELTLIHGGVPAGSEVDMYGLDANASAAVDVSAFYLGAYEGDAATNVTPIQSAYLTKTTAIGRVSTSASGDAALKAYIIDQYENHAGVNKYVFIRINPTADWSDYQRMFVYGHPGAGVETARTAKLTVTFAATASVDEVGISALELYPNPISNGKLNVSLKGFSNSTNFEVYSITGKLVHAENVEANNQTSFDATLNLPSGLYIAKLNDGNVSKTQKLIIK